ncbi:hypothetical protein BKA70DRAFT_1345546 [Coprinopsis sp. MPI-PUGE-AT-0042]|nr:hypothetical protein BKA70DRAFT_1345546 [Coprinopsis sp. MPI-PUGE-AT-0042]
MHETMDAYMALFDSKPHLLRFICSLAIRFDKSKGLAPPAHFFSTVIPFFAGNLRDLRHILIFSRRWRSWKIFPNDSRLALVSCVPENAGLTSFKAVGVGLPKAFSGLLPVDLGTYFVGATLAQEDTVVEKYLSTQGVANARPTYLMVPSLMARRTTCWVQSQDQSFFGRLQYLDFGVSNLSALTALLSRAACRLKGLTLRHTVFSTARLTLHHIGFALLPPGSRFAVMPQLEQLRIVFRCNPLLSSFSCPGRVPIIIADYCTSSFASVNSLCMDIKWAVPQGRPRKFQPSILRPQPGPGSGFARLDNLLANQDVLKELKNVTLNIGIAYNSLAFHGRR